MEHNEQVEEELEQVRERISEVEEVIWQYEDELSKLYAMERQLQEIAN